MNTELQQQLTNLVTALEEATVLAKQLPSTTTATATANIYASLRTAHRHLSLFLTQQTDNNDDDDEPMQIADEVETVEERMKDCSIQTNNNNNNNNKRLKRSLSSTSLAGGERMRWMDYDYISESFNYESSISNVNRLRALDLIYQFHS